jgi:hypothetical protein
MDLVEFQAIQDRNQNIHLHGRGGYPVLPKNDWTIIIRDKNDDFSVEIDKEELSVFTLRNANQEEVIIWIAKYFQNTRDWNTVSYDLVEGIKSIQWSDNRIRGTLTGYNEYGKFCQESIVAYREIGGEDYHFEREEL